MSFSKIFFYSCLIFIGGIFLASVLTLPAAVNYPLLILIFACMLGQRRNKYYLVLGFWLFALFLGILRYQLAAPQINPGQIQFYNNQFLKLDGLVSKEPDFREDKVKLEIAVTQVLINSQWSAVKGKVLVTTALFPEYQYGDQLELDCNLLQPEPINDFQYDKYLARYDIYSLCYNPEIKLLAPRQGNLLLTGIYNFKNYFISRLNRILPEPQSSFLAGLLIGAKKSIPPQLAAVFSQTGTTHIIAVSGYNVAIIVAFLMLLAQNLSLSRKKAFWLILLFLAVFLLLTGLQASIIRATIMASLVLLANYLGRTSRVSNALLLTAVIMLLINPKILVFDLGFQLSFLATLGLIYLNPVLIKLTNIANCKLPIVKSVFGDYLLTTLSAIILTTPLILFQFGKLALIAPLANILILPVIPLAMLLGFVAGLLALIFLPLGQVVGWLVWLVLSYIIWILEKLAGLNWAYWEIDKISAWLMFLSYGLIVIFILKLKKVYSR